MYTHTAATACVTDGSYCVCHRRQLLRVSHNGSYYVCLTHTAAITCVTRTVAITCVTHCSYCVCHARQLLRVTHSKLRGWDINFPSIFMDVLIAIRTWYMSYMFIKYSSISSFIFLWTLYFASPRVCHFSHFFHSAKLSVAGIYSPNIGFKFKSLKCNMFVKKCNFFNIVNISVTCNIS